MLGTTIILVMIAMMADGMRDLIRHHPHKIPLWMKGRDYWNPKVTDFKKNKRWITRGPLPLLVSGWHLLKELQISFFCLAIAINLPIEPNFLMGYAVFRAAAFIGFEITWK
jgi:hypothetical protein